MVMTLAILTLALLYWFPLRRWFARWGTTADEIARAMPGDSLIPDANHSATHAVTIYAAPEDIWPWLARMGYQRGGLYSYDWLDRLFGFLDRPSADRIIPEFQKLEEGDHHRTRLVSRGTVRVPANAVLWLFMRVMEPAAFIMTRRMLLGVKQRAEALRAQRAARPDCERQAA